MSPALSNPSNNVQHIFHKIHWTMKLTALGKELKVEIQWCEGTQCFVVTSPLPALAQAQRSLNKVGIDGNNM